MENLHSHSARDNKNLNDRTMIKSSILPALVVVISAVIYYSDNPIISHLTSALVIIASALIIRHKTNFKS